MIYEAMKWLIEWLVWTYKCECGSSVTEKDVDIVWAAWNTVNLDIICPKCHKHWMVKSELILMNMNWLAEVKHVIENLKNKISTKSEKIEISDKEITDLSKDLKKEINASDLFE